MKERSGLYFGRDITFGWGIHENLAFTITYYSKYNLPHQ